MKFGKIIILLLCFLSCNLNESTNKNHIYNPSKNTNKSNLELPNIKFSKLNLNFGTIEKGEVISRYVTFLKMMEKEIWLFRMSNQVAVVL